ncbi:MAG TPA: hypothetical protein DCG85_07835 [Lachnospiraceae bacterium]|nr:hypothetical protein [Lachnospiraceae bacterium]
MNKATGIYLSISVVVLFICAGLIAYPAFNVNDADDLHVVVTVSDKVVLDELLSSDIQKKIETPDGYNVIYIRNGSVCVTEADCKNHICVNSGFIDKKGQVIACIPHRLLVTIEDGGEQ